MITNAERLTKIRIALLGVAGFLFAGTIGELLAVKHYDGNVNLQIMPFLLCGLGLAGLLVAVFVREGKVIVAVRLVMVGIAASSLIGFYQHLNVNAEFARALPKIDVPGVVKGRVDWSEFAFLLREFWRRPQLSRSLQPLTALRNGKASNDRAAIVSLGPGPPGVAR